MTTGLVLTDVDARGVATVTLNRPDVHNAFNDEVISALMDAFETIAAGDGVRVLILAANGKSFSAGADLKWMRRMADFSVAENEADAMRLAHMFDRLNGMPMPTIAKVQGPAFAGGLGLISACDVAIGVETAKFAVTEVRLGLIAATISPYVIAAIGPSAARRYFQTAARFDAEEAARIGLLHDVVAPDALDGAVDTVVQNILRNAPASVAASKRLIHETAGVIDDGLLKETAARIARARATDEGKEGIAAFFEKRKPVWSTEGEGRP